MRTTLGQREICPEYEKCENSKLKRIPNKISSKFNKSSEFFENDENCELF